MDRRDFSKYSLMVGLGVLSGNAKNSDAQAASPDENIYKEPPKDLHIRKFDVVVVGAGTAGVVAAMAAARQGAKTMLIERKGYTGGTVTEGGTALHSFYNLWKAFPGVKKTQVVRGIAQDIIDRLLKVGGTSGHAEMELLGSRWVCKMHATAIIMAGGQSKRMGRDKSMLQINGKPAIEHIFQQLRPHFDHILISSNDKDKHSFLGVDIVHDEAPSKGPLMGIASALKASATEVNFVIACDIPQVDISLVRQMIRESTGYDAVIPRSADSRYEPLFAVYKKSIVDVLDKALTTGNYRIVDALSNCTINYLDLADGRNIRNLNTMTDYEDFCRD